MRCTTLTTLLTGVMLYLGMGALVFVTLESPKESEAHENLLKAKQVFLSNKSCVSEVDFHELVKVSPDKPDWFSMRCITHLLDFLQSVIYFLGMDETPEQTCEKKCDERSVELHNHWLTLKSLT